MTMPTPTPPLPADPHPESTRLLAVGLDHATHQSLSRWASEEGIHLDTAPDPPRAVRQLASGGWHLVLTVLEERPEDDLAWWAETLRTCAGRPRLIVAAGRPSMRLVALADRSAADVVRLPLRRDAFLQSVRRVIGAGAETALLLADVSADPVGSHHLVGQSPEMLDLYKMIVRAAASTATVLIEGESGTGKELVARALHLLGARAAKPFVAVNCAAIPETLLESELFGHERGAFTGAVTTRLGRFEQANGGTLFLDEVADMSLPLQAKILRAVQEGEVERLGGTHVIPVDVRLIAATNRDLRVAVDELRFRQDLYYRLAVVTLRLPRLAERGDDLFLLTSHFIREFSRRYGRSIGAISHKAFELLQQHKWVGNVRELRNIIERAVLVCDGDVLRSDHLSEDLQCGDGGEARDPTHELLTLRDVEGRHIAQVLARTDGHVGAAAELLGIHRNTLARKMQELGLR